MNIREEFVVEVRTVVEGAVSAHPAARDAYLTDHLFHTAVDHMVATLAAVAQVADQEGLSPWQRRDLIRQSVGLLLADAGHMPSTGWPA